jgi:acyl-coenzyme A synthetase/AMP-(fatty) acid ligase
VPKELEIVDDMQRTRTDKIDKVALRKRAVERQGLASAEASEAR